METNQPDTSTNRHPRRWAVVVVALIAICAAAALTLQIGGQHLGRQVAAPSSAVRTHDVAVSLSDIPAYAGKPSVEVNGNQPAFTDEELISDSFESYSELDELGRCGQAYALVGRETMPQGKRRSIGMIKPSGWQLSEYDWIDGRYLFNRCHLIAFALAGENDNPLNLITGTRTMNAQGMLPFEERVAAYIDRTGNHVLYCVTPMYAGDDLVASGVLMEARSVEDDGSGVAFCVWCYNVEPGVVIDYATGENRAGDPMTERYAESGQAGADAKPTGDSPDSPSAGADGTRNSDGREGAADAGAAAAAGAATASSTTSQPAHERAQTYVLNVNTHRFHHPDCASVPTIKEKNKRVVEATRSDLEAKGFKPCGVCKP